MDTTVHAMYTSAEAARAAVRRLVELGIDRGAIEVIRSGEPRQTGSFAEGQSTESEAQLTGTVGSFAEGQSTESEAQLTGTVGSFAEGQSTESEAQLTAHVGSWGEVEPEHVPQEKLKGRLTSAGLSSAEAGPYVEGLTGENIAILARVPHAKAAEARLVLHP
jgi:hypothetical protein